MTELEQARIVNTMDCVRHDIERLTDRLRMTQSRDERFYLSITIKTKQEVLEHLSGRLSDCVDLDQILFTA